MQAIIVQDKSTIKAFQKVPGLIYANDANYIPHLKQDIEKIFDPARNKLFKAGKAIRWVFYNNNQLVGRVAAFVNNKTSKAQDQPTGGIGYFECINDQATADYIFDTAKQWLTEQGQEAMDGPINFGERNQFWGCLTKNFTAPNSYGNNYNPPYYPALFENYGFKTYFEQYVFQRSPYDPVQDVFLNKDARLKAHHKITYKNVVGMPLEKIAEDFLTVYNGAWGGHAGFKPMNMAAAQKTMQALKPIIDKKIVLFAYDGDEPIAFYISIPELNDIFKYVNGDLNLIGKLKFLYHKWRGTPKTMVGIVFGVVRKWHGKGVEGGIISFAKENLESTNYENVIMTWVGDFNPKMIKVCENLGAKRFRELKTFRYLFDRNKPFERCPVAD